MALLGSILGGIGQGLQTGVTQGANLGIALRQQALDQQRFGLQQQQFGLQQQQETRQANTQAIETIGNIYKIEDPNFRNFVIDQYSEGLKRQYPGQDLAPTVQLFKKLSTDQGQKMAQAMQSFGAGIGDKDILGIIAAANGNGPLALQLVTALGAARKGLLDWRAQEAFQAIMQGGQPPATAPAASSPSGQQPTAVSPGESTSITSTPLPTGVAAAPSVVDRIRNAAIRYGVDPNIAHAVASQETGGTFDNNLVSKKNARGIMGVTPAAAQDMGYSEADMADTGKNIDAGVRYLKQMIDKNQGNVGLGLAAYNAGLGAVKDAGGIPAFPETQAYVPAVLAQAQRYRAGQGGPGGATAPLVTVQPGSLTQAPPGYQQQGTALDAEINRLLAAQSAMGAYAATDIGKRAEETLKQRLEILLKLREQTKAETKIDPSAINIGLYGSTGKTLQQGPTPAEVETTRVKLAQEEKDRQVAAQAAQQREAMAQKMSNTLVSPEVLAHYVTAEGEPPGAMTETDFKDRVAKGEVKGPFQPVPQAQQVEYKDAQKVQESSANILRLLKIPELKMEAVIGSLFSNPSGFLARLAKNQIAEAVTPQQKAVFAEIARSAADIRKLEVGTRQTDIELKKLQDAIPDGTEVDVPTLEAKLQALQNGGLRTQAVLLEHFHTFGLRPPSNSQEVRQRYQALVGQSGLLSQPPIGATPVPGAAPAVAPAAPAGSGPVSDFWKKFEGAH